MNANDSSNDSIKQSLPHCRCDVLRNPWSSGYDKKAPKPTHLIAYIRVDDEPPSAEEQREQIESYCKKHGFELVSIYEDKGLKPGYGLARALSELSHVGGLIASDLNRFIHCRGDRLRDLKPFIHDFFCTSQKHLLTVKEGVDTGTPGGQRAAIEFISSTKDFV